MAKHDKRNGSERWLLPTDGPYAIGYKEPIMSNQSTAAPVVFKDIPGFPGYQATNCGRIWSIRSKKFLKPWLSGTLGYETVALPNNSKRYVHRLVLLAFAGEPALGNDGCHRDGNVRNNDITNLRWDSRSGNLADRDSHGTHQRGQQNPSAKLTDEQADEVRSRRASGEKLKSIADAFGVKESCISRIFTGERRGR